jgi:hypothetical protein
VGRGPSWTGAENLAPTGIRSRTVQPVASRYTGFAILAKKIKRWMDNQHLVLWRRPCSTQRQPRELISGPKLAIRARLLSFNMTQSRVVICLLTGHNTLRRHLYIMGLSNNFICRKCDTEEETSVHILCECEALASLECARLGFFFLNPKDIRKLSIGTIRNFGKGTGLL